MTLERLEIDLAHVQEFKPSTKKVSYDFAEALPNIAKALQLHTKVAQTTGNPRMVQGGSESKSASAPLRKIPELSINSFTGKYAAHKTFIKSFKLKFDPLEILPAEKLVHLQKL